MRHITIIIANVILIFLSTRADGKVCAAVSELNELLYTQHHVILNLESYLNKEEDRIRKLKKMLYSFKREFKLARENETEYLENPIRYFMLIKQLYFDLQDALDSVKKRHPELRYIKSAEFVYPDGEDLTGAAKAILAMTDIYHLSVNDLVHGTLNGFHTGLPLSAGECYVMGRELYQAKAYDYALAWLSQALKKYYEERNNLYSFNQVQIMEMIASIYAVLERFDEATAWIEEILNIDENNSLALKFKAVIIKHELEPKGLQYVKPKKITFQRKTIERNQSQIYNQLDIQSEALCRGKTFFQLNSTFNTPLRQVPVCRYLISEPFYKLAPLKLEELYRNPDIMLIYDIISNKEAENIIEDARPQLSYDEYHPDFCKYFKYDEKSETTLRLTNRLINLYGLEYSGRVRMTAMNYGIAGYSVPIIESIDEGSDEQNIPTLYGSLPTLFSYITAQIFLSDVTQGGNIVFPFLDLIVPPKKNAILIWLRNIAAGTGDTRTIYTSCPVLRGSKWVARLQISAGPCGLIYEVADGLASYKHLFKAITNKNILYRLDNFHQTEETAKIGFFSLKYKTLYGTKFDRALSTLKHLKELPHSHLDCECKPTYSNPKRILKAIKWNKEKWKT